MNLTTLTWMVILFFSLVLSTESPTLHQSKSNKEDINLGNHENGSSRSTPSNSSHTAGGSLVPILVVVIIVLGLGLIVFTLYTIYNCRLRNKFNFESDSSESFKHPETTQTIVAGSSSDHSSSDSTTAALWRKNSPEQIVATWDSEFIDLMEQESGSPVLINQSIEDGSLDLRTSSEEIIIGTTQPISSIHEPTNTVNSMSFSNSRSLSPSAIHAQEENEYVHIQRELIQDHCNLTVLDNEISTQV